ncbi:MAG TPA: DsbA family protein [Candidatus Marinimicrobia bacterium]|nr:DsbA family protein [Candidatus Neomarinimicrobiota bacterium]|tara:strand:- start:968 stop:2290 length:1323 start_codon:yes stop_codon:yes gene_type:complete
MKLEKLAKLVPSEYLLRVIRSSMMSRFSNLELRDKQRIKIESQRKQRNQPHTVIFFFQSNDPYSALAAQFLHQIQSLYDIKLEIYLVGEEGYDALPEPEMYRKYVFSDVQEIAPYYDIDFSNTHIPSTEEKDRFLSHLCSLNQEELIAQLPSISLKFWRGEFSGNTSSKTTIKNTLNQGNKKRDECGHYLGGIFHYGGENYWGIDRLNFLLKRLEALGVSKGISLRVSPALNSYQSRQLSDIKLEIFFSANSPYTYLAFDRVKKLGETYGMPIVVRPIMPMLMRKMDISRRKGLYILSDAARIAKKLNIPFGKVKTPIGYPIRRMYSLFPYVDSHGKGFDYLHKCMEAIFATGKNVGSKSFLRELLSELNLNIEEGFKDLDTKNWETEFEQNRLDMYQVNCWGAPTFKLFHKNDNILSIWGQDRIWLLEEKLKKIFKQTL